MRRSKLFVKTRHQVPSDEASKSAQLLIRAGFIHKDSAGVYALLPFGLRVIDNIKKIVREEMDSLGSGEMLMTSLQRKEVWQRTDRWDDKKVDIWFKSKLQNGTEVGLAWSHEEPISDMMREFIASYRDLPTSLYQFQTKLRNELRAKTGVMRSREFLMKDMYSYAADQKQHDDFYKQATEAYHRVFERLGIGDITFFTFASGGAFTRFSHEFQTLCEAGEDIAYFDRAKKIAVNEEVLSDEVLNDLKLDKSQLEKVKVAEVGNIFSFGTSKSEQLGLYFTDKDGTKKPVVLGSYGIGITRLMGVLAEIFADERGLLWPDNVAPFKVYLARLGSESKVLENADEIYQRLTASGISVLYDDRDMRAGEMFADADLIGLPYRLVISEKTVKNMMYEIKPRTSKKSQDVSGDSLVEILATV